MVTVAGSAGPAMNPQQAGRPASVAAMIAALRRAPSAWLLGAFYPLDLRRDGQVVNAEPAGETMNESRLMGATAQAVVARLRQSPLAGDCSIQETPRALHQPYLEADGTPKDRFFTEPTGVFNTAELLANQLGLTPGCMSATCR